MNFFILSHIYGDIDVAAIWKCLKSWENWSQGWEICPIYLEEMSYQLWTEIAADF